MVLDWGFEDSCRRDCVATGSVVVELVNWSGGGATALVSS